MADAINDISRKRRWCGRPGKRALLRFRRAALGVSIALGVSYAFAAAPGSVEIAIKATYLYKIPPFIEWPTEVFSSGASPFTICVVGADPFGAVLDQAVAGQRLGERAIVLRRMGVVQPMSGCQVLFVSGSTEQSVQQALDTVHGEHVLTITDNASTPGIIQFVIQNNRVRFDIDDAAAAQNGLTVSSKLLSLAHAVKPKS
jgi:hypothetical protein